jgi:hypothetical protein
MSKTFSLAQVVTNIFPCTWDQKNFSQVCTYDTCSIEEFTLFNQEHYPNTHDAIREALDKHCSIMTIYQDAVITNIAQICNIPIIIIDGLHPWVQDYEPAVFIFGIGIVFSRKCDQIAMDHEMIHSIQYYMGAMGLIKLSSDNQDEKLTCKNKIFMRIRFEFQAYLLSEPGIIGTLELGRSIKAITGHTNSELHSLLSTTDYDQIMMVVSYLRQIEYLTNTCNQHCNIDSLITTLFENYDLETFLTLV